jgi:hypothetical protein
MLGASRAMLSRRSQAVICPTWCEIRRQKHVEYSGPKAAAQAGAERVEERAMCGLAIRRLPAVSVGWQVAAGRHRRPIAAPTRARPANFVLAPFKLDRYGQLSYQSTYKV